jgi:hypothetical protein
MKARGEAGAFINQDQYSSSFASYKNFLRGVLKWSTNNLFGQDMEFVKIHSILFGQQNIDILHLRILG